MPPVLMSSSSGPGAYKVRLMVREARNLLAADKNGKSDPYVKVRAVDKNGATVKVCQQQQEVHHVVLWLFSMKDLTTTLLLVLTYVQHQLTVLTLPFNQQHQRRTVAPRSRSASSSSSWRIDDAHADCAKDT